MSRNGPFIFFRVIGALLLIGLIAAGGFMAYRAGVAQGVMQAPVVATAISQAAENGQVAPVPPMMYQNSYGYGHGYGYGRHHFGFFPFGICGSILFIFLFFGFMKMIFFHGMHHRGHGPCSRHWEDGVPSKFNEWHKHAHDEKSADNTDKKE